MMVNIMNWIFITFHMLINFKTPDAKQVVIKKGSMDSGWFGSALEVGGGAGILWTNPKRSDGRDFSNVCGKGTDNLLITTHLSLRDAFAKVIYVDIDAELTKCSPWPCDNYFFEVYIYHGNTEPTFPATKGEKKDFLEKNFVPTFNITNKTTTKVTNRRENQTFTFVKRISEGVTFGIRSRGACGKIYKIKVYYYYCKETFISGVKFSKTVAPAHGVTEVTAHCSVNSSPSNDEGLKGYCQSNGSWKIRNDTKCFCNKGFEINSSLGCSACRVGRYKSSNSSNEKCRLCPLNNVATNDKSGCKCKYNHYKLYQSNIGPCYALPHYPLELRIKPIVETNSVNITWDSPKLQGEWNETLIYEVMCYRCLRRSLCNASCGYITYSSHRHNLTQTFIEIYNLELGSSYVFRVYPVNSLNMLVERNKWNYTQTRYLIPEQIESDRMEEDGGFWPYIYVVAAACAVLFLTVIILMIIILKRRANFKRELIIKNPNQVELPSIGHRLYIDPTIYDSLEDALNEFASELDRSVVVLDMLIGGGEFGDVYKGQMSRNNGAIINVAVKTLKRDAIVKSEKDFLLEASVMAQFNDPNVIRLEGVITKSIPRMIIIEFMSNGSLDHFLQNNENKLSRFQLISMARGVASGMKYLARINFVHRDLAARNILVNERLFCKISDFGLSRALDTEGLSRGEYSTSGGKIPIRWTAPEAIEYRKFSSASDVWSYGILLWEIMTFGDRPYGQWDNFRVLREVDEGFRLLSPEGCPKAVHDLMLRCWNCVRYERPTFADILATIDDWITSPDMIRDNTSNVLSAWLQSIKMGTYAWHLIAAGYRSPSQLSELKDSDLMEMGITLIGHRNKILKGIKAMHGVNNLNEHKEKNSTSSVDV